ncbi:hypothetical protein HA050_19180 [Iodobacter sp. HSC-16F04]|uniref:Uncharacterized protein n=1 Tax=Iodobacter violaceini TaxID=3044271 RepID=A0ABX0L438_9NEIS|nr:hypothetical protein [Iodobacter violacea]NHQ88231.1 hypothetical protein [Iodobacter violacea]
MTRTTRILYTLLFLTISCLSTYASAIYWPWPLNGKVVNQSSLPVAVWDGEHGIYTLPAHSFSPKALDVDHLYSSQNNNWCKIGPLKVQIDSKGNIDQCECWVENAGDACDSSTVVAEVKSSTAPKVAHAQPASIPVSQS